MPPMMSKHPSHRYLPLMATVLIFIVLGCGLPENYREVFQYYDDSTGTVSILENYEARLRCLANKASEGALPENWQQQLVGTKEALEKLIATEKQTMGEWNEKLKMKFEMLNWLEALHVACIEGLKPATSQEKTAVNMYHYLDLAGEMGRIVRSDRELLVGHYMALH
jgi:hypothetical protein